MKKLFSLLLLAMASMTLMAQETCSPITSLPWTESFEGMTVGQEGVSSITCWEFLNCNQGDYPYVQVNNRADYCHKGTQSLFFQTGAYRCSYAILPEFTDLSETEIRFWYRNENSRSTNGIMAVGYITDPTDSATFVALQTLSRVSSMKEVVQSLATVPADARIAFRLQGTTNSNMYASVDDIVIHYPGCPAPTNIHPIDDLATSSSVTFAWDNMSAEQYRVLVKSGTDTLVNTLTTDTFCIVSGLEAATAYDLSITLCSFCNDGKMSRDTEADMTVSTLCDAITSFPWTEDFEEMPAGSIGTACWTNRHISGPSSDLFTVNGNTHDGNSSHQGCLPDMQSTTITRLQLPLMDFGEPNTYQFSIDVDRNATTTADKTEGLRIFAGNQELGFIARHHEAADGDRVPAEAGKGWFTYDFVIPVGGEQHITIQGVSKYGSSTYFDNLVVRTIPSCQKPTNIHILDDLTTTSSATIAWSAPDTGAEQYRVLVKSGTNYADTLVNTIVTDTFCIVSGLEAGTAYMLSTSVTSICGEGEESRPKGTLLSTQTDCDAITSFPWTEDFESLSTTAISTGCWINKHIAGPGSKLFEVATSDNGGNSSHQGKLPDMLSGTITRLRLPNMDFGEPYSYVLSIDVYRNSSYSSHAAEGLRIFVGDRELGFISRNITVADGGFVTAESSEGWYTYEFSIPVGGEQHITIQGESKYGSATYFDNITVKAATGCMKPYGIHIATDLLTTSSATIAWLAPATGAEQYRVLVTSGTDTLVNTLTTDTFCLLSGLESDTIYTLRTSVTSICGEGEESDPVVAPLTAEIPCGFIASFPWTEDFEGMTASQAISGECWTNKHIAGNGSYIFMASTASTGSNKTVKGRLPDMVSGTITQLRLPMMDFGETISYRFSIDVYRNSSSSNYAAEGLRIFVGNQEIAFISRNYEIADGDRVPAESTAGWYTYRFTIPAGGKQYITIQGESKYGSDTYFDNLMVDPEPTCPAASKVHLVDSLTTSTSATIAWSAPAEGAEQYRVLVTSGTDTLVNTLTTDTFFLISDLERESIYTLSATVTGVCGEDDESDPAVATMTVYLPCDAITSFPWTENFEGMTAGQDITAGCWFNEHISGPSSNLFMASYSNTDGNATVKGRLPDMYSGTITRLSLPLMDFGEPGTYRFSIDVFRNSSTASYAGEGLRLFAGDQELGFISRIYTAADSTRVPAETGEGWYTYQFVIPVGGVQRIIIQGESQYGSSTYFDNLVVDLVPTDPTALPAAAASGALRAAKFVRDGHIYIVLPDGTTFDATGRRVN